MNSSVDNVYANESNETLPIVATGAAQGDHPQCNNDDPKLPTPLNHVLSPNRRRTRLWTRQQRQQQKQKQKQQKQQQQEQAFLMKNMDVEGLNLNHDLANTDATFFAVRKNPQPNTTTNTTDDATNLPRTVNSTSTTDVHQATESISYPWDESIIKTNKNVGTTVRIEETSARSTEHGTASRNNQNEEMNNVSKFPTDNPSASLVPEERTVRGKDIIRLHASFHRQPAVRSNTTNAPKVLSSSQKDHAIMFGIARQNARNTLQQWICANQALTNGAAPVIILYPISIVSINDTSHIPISPNEWFLRYLQQYVPAMQRLFTKRHEVLEVADEIVENICGAGAKFSAPDAPYTCVPLPLAVKHISEQLEVNVLGRKRHVMEWPPGTFPNVPFADNIDDHSTYLGDCNTADPKQWTMSTPPITRRTPQGLPIHNMFATATTTTTTNPVPARGVTPSPAPPDNNADFRHPNDVDHQLSVRSFTPIPEIPLPLPTTDTDTPGSINSTRLAFASEGEGKSEDEGVEGRDDLGPIPLSRPTQPLMNLKDPDVALSLVQVPSFEQVLLDQQKRLEKQRNESKAFAIASNQKRRKRRKVKRRRRRSSR